MSVKAWPTLANENLNLIIDTGQLRAASPMSGSASRLLFRHQILGKYRANYFYDEKAGYIFVGEPHWLDEAYSQAISPMDTGILARNLSNIETISWCLLENNHNSTDNGIDLGAGCGLFVRGLRD